MVNTDQQQHPKVRIKTVANYVPLAMHKCNLRVMIISNTEIHCFMEIPCAIQFLGFWRKRKNTRKLKISHEIMKNI